MEIHVFMIKVKRRKHYFDVLLGDDFYCSADTLREALLDAEQLHKELLAIHGNSLFAPIEIDIN